MGNLCRTAQHRGRFDEMLGRDTGRSFKLGQRIRIVVDGVDYFQKSIDFVLAPEEDREEG